MTARRRAFTLVELLVVIIIIGILAAVAIPQFGSKSEDAKKNALKQNLRTLRSAIERYYHDHNNVYPGATADGRKHSSDGNAGGDAHTDAADAFVKQLTMYSDQFGNTSTVKNDTNFPFQPYIKQKLPDNPIPTLTAASDPDSLQISSSSAPLSETTGEIDGATGWVFSTSTGELVANNATYKSY
jgi:general secretion pathway protein G